MATPEFVTVVIDRPEAAMSFRVEAYEEAGRIVCGIYHIRGTRKAGPKAFIKAVREEIERLEQAVRARGAQEMRIGGRWGRKVVTGYEPFPDPSDPLRMRKVFNA